MKLKTAVAQWDQERRTNTGYLRTKSQLDLVKSELHQFRKKNLELIEERLLLKNEVDQVYGTVRQIGSDFGEEKAQLLEKLAEQQSSAELAHHDLANANMRIRELVAKLCRTEELLADAHRIGQELKQTGKISSIELAGCKSQLVQTTSSLELMEKKCRTIELGSRRLDAQRTLIIHRLLYVLLLLHGFSVHLGERLVPALRSKSSILSRWRLVSAQKVEARRALVRYLYGNQELQQELHQLYERQEDLEKEARKYRSLYNNSMKSRDLAAKKFRRFYCDSLSYYSTTTTRLLAGLFALWRMNLIYSKRLADTQVSLRDLEKTSRLCLPGHMEVAVPCNLKSKSFADASVQWASKSSTMSSKDPIDAAVQCVPRPNTGDRSRNPSHAPAVSLPGNVSVPTTRERTLTFGVTGSEQEDCFEKPVTAPLCLHEPSIGTTIKVDHDRMVLDERVQRLVRKFDALAAVHHSYRGLLLEKTRLCSPSVESDHDEDAFQQRAPLLLDRCQSLAASIHAGH
jgi:hypothetical protein